MIALEDLKVDFGGTKTLAKGKAREATADDEDFGW